MSDTLNILMIAHHRRFKALFRSHAMARYLVERGHSVTEIVIADERKFGIIESDWDGVHSVETPDLLWGQLRSGWDVWNLLNRLVYLGRVKRPFDLVHCFETRPATIYPALSYVRRARVPLLTDWVDWWGRGGIIDEFRPKWYSTLFGGIETYYEEAFRASATGLTVISHGLRERAVGLGVSPERILQIPNGIDPELFKARPKAACREHVGMSPTDPVLAFSSLDSHFDLALTMEALAIVAQHYPNVKLLITGKMKDSVRQLAQTYGVEGNIHPTGFLPFEELPWYLGCADVFVLPFPDKMYNVGRWPNKMGDYMSLGRPTVSNPVGDIKRLFESHAVGLLAEWDAQDFARQIITLLDNPDEAQRMGDTARQIAVNNYDWRVLITNLEDFYRKMLTRETAPAPA